MRDSLGGGKENLKNTHSREKESHLPWVQPELRGRAFSPQALSSSAQVQNLLHTVQPWLTERQKLPQCLPVELTGNLPSGTGHKSFLQGAREALHQRHFTTKPPGGTVKGRCCWPPCIETSEHQRGWKSQGSLVLGIKQAQCGSLPSRLTHIWKQNSFPLQCYSGALAYTKLHCQLERNKYLKGQINFHRSSRKIQLELWGSKSITSTLHEAKTDKNERNNRKFNNCSETFTCPSLSN